MRAVEYGFGMHSLVALPIIRSGFCGGHQEATSIHDKGLNCAAVCSVNPGSEPSAQGTRDNTVDQRLVRGPHFSAPLAVENLDFRGRQAGGG